MARFSVGDNRPAYIVERDRKEAEAAQRRAAIRENEEDLRRIMRESQEFAAKQAAAKAAARERNRKDAEAFALSEAAHREDMARLWALFAEVRDGLRKEAEAQAKKEAADGGGLLSRLPEFGKTFWDTYKKTDGYYWHPSKSTEDNLRGYAETAGEIGGGTAGAVLGALGGAAAGGPVAPAASVGGATGVGYLGGKGGKSFGRNAFNWAVGSEGTQGGVDSIGRNTGFGVNNADHGNDFVPKLHDAGYAIPALGGALRVPMGRFPSHVKNLAGKMIDHSQQGNEVYTPLYQSLPWSTRYSLGPDASLKYQVNLSQPTKLERWQHGRVVDLDKGHYAGESMAATGRVPDRNLRYQVAKHTDTLDKGIWADPNIDTRQALTEMGLPDGVVVRLLANKGELSATMGDKFPYKYPSAYVDVPEGSPSFGWVDIPNRRFQDVRSLSDAQAAPLSLTGQ